MQGINIDVFKYFTRIHLWVNKINRYFNSFFNIIKKLIGKLLTIFLKIVILSI